MAVHSNDTRNEQQTGQSSQRQSEKHGQDFDRANPNEAKGQRKQNQGCDADTATIVAGPHCGIEGQEKDQPQKKGQSQPQRQSK
jgi:hypothetical protein